jgi:hypothetical protein
MKRDAARDIGAELLEAARRMTCRRCGARGTQLGTRGCRHWDTFPPMRPTSSATKKFDPVSGMGGLEIWLPLKA